MFKIKYTLSTIIIALILVIMTALYIDKKTTDTNTVTPQKNAAIDEKKQSKTSAKPETSSTQIETKANHSQVKSEEEETKNEARIDAPLIRQLPELPNGCEVTSLTMLLNQAGLKVNKMTLASQIKKVPFKEGNYNGNPNEGFVGNLYHGGPGYAAYHGPVFQLAERYLGDRAVDLTGKEWRQIEEQLASGSSIWVINNVNFNELPESQFITWHTKQGNIKITYKEHSVLVTGYDQDYVYFNDPLTNTKNKKVRKSAFIQGWKQMGSQAISFNSRQKLDENEMNRYQSKMDNLIKK
ncbi:C39 family peptidase [Terrilactibacillus tamarindi]|nr:C39 family peptidase [Terrilactibacillus tamarindi]